MVKFRDQVEVEVRIPADGACSRKDMEFEAFEGSTVLETSVTRTEATEE